MKFFDFVKIYLKAGNGGGGAVSFYKDWMQKRSHPDGGNGANAGNIVFVASKDVDDLSYFLKKRKIVSLNGGDGRKRSQHGKKSDDLIIKVPVGTVIFSENQKEILFDFQEDQQSFIIAHGGLGGRGNESLYKGKFPKLHSQSGTLGEQKTLYLDLRLFSNLALIGLPNAGKTSLLNALTKSKGKIGSYSFTTLHPNLGILKDQINNQKVIISDLPGLIYGAHLNRGLGNKFLKHLFRCQIFIHLLDFEKNYQQIIEDFLLINHELFSYHQYLKDIPQLIVFNKVDLCIDNEKQKKLQKYFKNFTIIFVSATKKIQILQLKKIIFETFSKYQNNKTAMERWLETQDFNISFYRYRSEKELRLRKIQKNMWTLSGKAIIALLSKLDLENENDLQIFNQKLKKTDLFKKIKNEGVNNNDVVYIHGKSFVWKD